MRSDPRSLVPVMLMLGVVFGVALAVTTALAIELWRGLPPPGRRRRPRDRACIRVARRRDWRRGRGVDLIERLRAERPAAEITWVCGEVARPVVELFVGVARIITVDQRALLHGSMVARARVVAGSGRSWLAGGLIRRWSCTPTCDTACFSCPC